MAETETTTETGAFGAALAKLLAAHLVVQVPEKTAAGEQVIVAPAGFSVHKLAPVNPVLPADVTAQMTVITPESFAEYVNRFKGPSSIAKASLSARSVVAILDYHGASNGDKAVPNYAKHAATLQSDYHEDWKAWSGVFGDYMGQAAYGEFIEDMAHTIAEPTLAVLLEVVRTVDIDRQIKLKSKTNPQSSAVVLTYEEVDSSGGSGPSASVTIPTEITLLLPVFHGTEAIAVKCRLKYKLERGALQFAVTVPGVEKIISDEFVKLAELVQDATDIPLFYTA